LEFLPSLIYPTTKETFMTDPVVIPTTEAEMAEVALRTAMELALMPLQPAVRMSALNTVLSYTKAKPAQKTDLRVGSAEQWLAEVMTDA
jgi:hypothetical protein